MEREPRFVLLKKNKKKYLKIALRVTIKDIFISPEGGKNDVALRFLKNIQLDVLKLLTGFPTIENSLLSRGKMSYNRQKTQICITNYMFFLLENQFNDKKNTF